MSINNKVEVFSEDILHTIQRLPKILTREGYADSYNLYGAINVERTKWQQNLNVLPTRLQTLTRFFLLGESVKIRELENIFSSQDIKNLGELSLIIGNGETVSTGNLIIIPFFGYFMIVQKPNINPMIYFGEDSAALLSHLTPSVGSECLDLCAGPGIQSLMASGLAKKVTAVEINPLVAALTELNIQMNGLSDKIEIKNGDLYQAVPDLQFDFICANPPLLPFPDNLPFPFVGHGGADGLEITRTIMNGLSEHLRGDGLCQIIGSCLGTDEEPLWIEELEEFSERGYKTIMTIPTSFLLEPNSRLFEGLAWSCATSGNLEFTEVKNIYEEHLNKLNATHLYFFFLTISKTNKDKSLSITRHYRQNNGFWFI